MQSSSNARVDTRQDIDSRLDFLGLDDAGRAQIRNLAPVVERELPKGLDRFYDKVRKTPETSKFFSSDEHMRGAKGAQIGHWNSITSGKFDEDYVRRVRAIGSVHAEIGLEPRWYIGGYSLIIEQFIHGVLADKWPKGSMFGKNKGSSEETAELLSTLVKAIMLDMDLSISVYMDKAEERRRHAQEEAMETMRRTVSCFTKAISHLSSKDLTYRIGNDLPAGYESLRDDFNSALQVLGETIEQIRGSAEQIHSGSEEIRAAADDLSKRAEQQAAAVEETAAAIEEITATVKSSAGRAEEAGALVGRTRSNAEQSGDVVRKAVDAMGRISKSSDDISRIIGVIDEIAFQTNLLALNAGVEAARAGDAGKGFAVVAQEVRELAQRSAAAAKEIKQLITASGDEVKNGVSLVGETGKALETIVSEVQEIAVNVEAIIDSAREQSTGLQEINIAITSVDQGTQQNAAMSEQLTASSHSLGNEVASINAMLQAFETGPEAPRAPVAVSEAAPARPRPSPARDLSRKVANAFSGNAAPAGENWEEF